MTSERFRDSKLLSPSPERISPPVEPARRFSPPWGGIAPLQLRLWSLGLVPFGLVAYLMWRSAGDQPAAIQTAGWILLAASVVIGRWGSASKRPDAQRVAAVALTAALADLLVFLWPASFGWIVLIWCVTVLAAYLAPRFSLLGLLACVGLFLGFAGSHGQLRQSGNWWVLLTFAGVYVIGVQRRAQRQYVSDIERLLAEQRAYSLELEEAHRQLQAEALQAAALAAAEERNRIAREIHDVLAHSLTVLVVQAQAIKRLVRSDPAAAEAQAETLAGLARDGLQEARRSVSALRVQSAVDGLATLRGLVEDFGARTGVASSFDVSGSTSSLSPNAWTTLYRVTQEALTNAQRHGHARSVAVRLAVTDAVHLSIDDDGSAAVDFTPGNGLTGMRERAERLGGHLRYAVRPEGGFHIDLELPA